MNCVFKQVRLLAAFKNVAKNQTAQLHVTNPVRFITKYLDSIVNIFDNERNAKVGAERLCAEWVLKCGGRIRWVGSENWVADYNSLPEEKTTKHLLKVQDVDLSESVVMSNGIKHLHDVKELKSLKLHMCKYLDDKALQELILAPPTLKHLQISNNKKISDTGLLHLTELRFLHALHLKNLPRVSNKQAVYNKLQMALPNCEIVYVDLET